MHKLILNLKKKEFLYKGYFYGYVQDEKVFIQNEKTNVNFSVNLLCCFVGDIPAGTMSVDKVRCLTISNIDDELEINEPGLYDYNKEALPDLVFTSKYLMYKFYKFVTACQDI